MLYKAFKDENISRLGMGNMRLPVVGEGRYAPIAYEKAQAIIDYVYANGVNYFDTAYMYHGGESEKFLGRALAKFPRDSYYLADKYPLYLLKDKKTPESVFEEQLERCKTNYFDFYLLHNVSDGNIGEYLADENGYLEYFLQQKKNGRIRHFGFSSHSSPANLEKFLDWQDCWEFVQIQLNYMDWTLQDAKRKYEILTERGMPIWVMEPCRGGHLASLGEDSNALLKEARPDDSIASWAFRFVQDLPNVQVVLSGMTTMEQAVDNVDTFSRERRMTKSDEALLFKVVNDVLARCAIPCTGCRYCCNECLMGLDIPRLISMYNEQAYKPTVALMMAMCEVSGKQKPSNCLSCGRCSKVCPQGIDIPGVMKKLTTAFGEAASFILASKPKD